MLLDDLTWTTREEIANRLLTYLQETRAQAVADPPQPVYPARDRVAELLAHLATPQHQKALLALALDPHEEDEVRRIAVRSLGELEASVSWPELLSLLNEPDPHEDEQPRFELPDILRLSRTPQALDAAKDFLHLLDAESRVTALMALWPSQGEVGHPLADWLYANWLECDRHALSSEEPSGRTNRVIIRRTRDRVESLDVLQDLWRMSEGDFRNDCLNDLRGAEHEWEFPGPLAPAEVEELTLALALPLPRLLDRLGSEGLLAALEQTLAEEVSPSAADRWGRPQQPSPETRRRLMVLWHWRSPEVDNWMAEQILRSQLHYDLRSALLAMLHERNARLAALTLTRELRAGDHELSRWFVWWYTHTPGMDDEELLREAIRPEHPQQLRYDALCGLDRLAGAASDWVEILSVIALDEQLDPRLRLRATGALARRGDPDALRVLIATATEESDLRIRATAIWILGEVASEAALPVLREAIRCSGPEFDLCAPTFDGSPLAEEAALALAQINSPEARTMLMHAFLQARTRGLIVVANDCLREVLETPVDEPVRPIHPTMSWRQGIPWRWRS